MFTQVTECPWESDMRSLKTPETPGLSITFGTLSACRSFETKDDWTFSHCSHDFLLLSCLYVCSQNAFNCCGKSKALTAKINSLKVKANELIMQYFYSGAQSVLEVLLLFTVGHRSHSPCFPLTLSSRVTAFLHTHLVGDFIFTDKYHDYWFLLVSVDDILN